MTDVQLQTVAECLRDGLSLRDSAVCAGFCYDTLRGYMAKGKAGQGPRTMEIYAIVRAAQVDFLRQVHRSLLKAARAGNPMAIDRLLSRAQAEIAEGKVEEVPDDPVEAARYRLADIRRRMVDASGIAYVQLQRAEAELARKIQADDAKRREAEVAASDLDARLGVFRGELRRMPLRLREQIRAIVLEEVGEDD